MRKTKIIATLGPAVDSIEKMKELISAGINGARVNFSHGTYESHGEMINRLKAAREELNAPIPLILDTKGPEIRVKKFANPPINLIEGQEFTLTTKDILGDETKVAVTYLDLAKDVNVGDKILLDDGLIELKVKSKNETDVICTVVNSGVIKDNKGVNIPDVYVNLPALTQKDIDDILFGIKMEFDYIAASFIRSADDVKSIRKLLEENNSTHIKIISKIENRDGVDNIDEILEASDGIMVARGDMGVEIDLEEVPLIQKKLIKKANDLGKLVATATQMLESMIQNPRPTRAEANDVANAIFDGTDIIMLSGETASGKYPVEAVTTMARIASSTENSINYNAGMCERKSTDELNLTDAIGYAAASIAHDLESPCITTITNSGFTANKVSKFRPSCPILAITDKDTTYRQLGLVWGVSPTICEAIDREDIFVRSLNIAKEMGYAKTGDIVVTVAGLPIFEMGTTNTIRVLSVI